MMTTEPTTNIYHKEKKNQKQQLIDTVQKCVDEYERVFAFSFENMRTNKFKDLRQTWKDSRFLLGRNKVMKLALDGNDRQNEYRPDLAKLAQVRPLIEKYSTYMEALYFMYE